MHENAKANETDAGWSRPSQPELSDYDITPLRTLQNKKQSKYTEKTSENKRYN